MSYANLVNQSCTDLEELFQRMRDFICKRNGTYDYSTTGIGWTLHDSSYATDEDNLTSNDWIVLYSAGEGGSDDLYVKITYKGNASAPYCCSYLYWNNSTHTGVALYGSVSAQFLQYVASPVWVLYIYGDLDGVSVVPDNVTDPTYAYGTFFGRAVDGPYNQDILTLASAYSSGSNVDITLPSTPSYGYEQWKNIYIRDDAHIEIIQIEVIAGNVITADLVNSYAAGAKIQADLCYIANNSANFSHSSSSGHYSLIGRTGTVGGTGNGLLMTRNTAVFDDELQTIDAPAVQPAVVGYDATQFKGVGGRLPNMYTCNGTGFSPHNTLYNLNGVNHRYKSMKYASPMLFKEV